MSKLFKPEVIILLLILGLATYLRAYRLPEYMTFLGDEGRDALVIRNIVVNHDLPFIGAPTSVGNMYLGPLYYYMMAVAMAPFGLNPVAAAGMNVVIGLATIFLIYYLSRRWFGVVPALTTAFLYSVSPITIFYSRSSWNPNPAPFFVLLAVLGLDNTYRSRNGWWFVLVGASFAALLQMHYLALIMLPILGALWMHLFLTSHYYQQPIKKFWTGTVLGIVAFCLIMFPLVLFDLKHNFMNYRALTAFFTQRETTVNVNPLNSLGRTWPVYDDTLVSHYMTGQNMTLALIIGLLLLVPLGLGIYQRFSKKTINWPLLILGAWLIGGLLGLSLYKQTIYDHYLGFLSPAPYLLLAALMALLKQHWQQVAVALAVGGILAMVNLQMSPLNYPPNRQLQKTEAVADYVIEQSAGKPFNFALISKNNYDAAYQFHLITKGHPAQLLQVQITDQLFVVCEDPICEPVNNPKYEIAGFGWVTIEKESDFQGVKVYKLVHNPAQPK